MSEHQAPGPPPKMTLGEILYIVFRHKWKILLLSLAGVAGTAALPFVRPPAYQSEARLYIRYVVESRSPGQVGDGDARIRSPDVRGDSILNTEMEILTSMDLAQQVADAIGPEKVLARMGGGSDRLRAAFLIQKGLKAEVPRDTSVIHLAFQHRDPGIVQPVLKRLIEVYFKKHAEIHAVGAFDDFLTQETDQRRSQVAQTEEELRKAKAKAGIISLQDTKQAYESETARIQQQIFDTQAELAEHQAAASEMAKVLRSPLATVTNPLAGTNYIEAVPSEQMDEYTRVCALLAGLGRREQELLVSFTASNSLVREVRRQIETNELIKGQLERANPGLLSVRVLSTNGVAAAPAADPRTGLTVELARVSGLESRLKVLNDQLNEVRKKAIALADAEGPITELQRRLQLQETNYTRFSQSLEQSQIDERLGAGKVANISTI